MFLRKPVGVENGETFEIVPEKGKIVAGAWHAKAEKNLLFSHR
jgi:hypothetical protein